MTYYCKIRFIGLYLFFLGLLFNIKSYSQDSIYKSLKNKGTIYFSWGYNRDWYTNSTLHFKGSNPNGNYDFEVKHTHAHDQPDMYNFFNTPLTVPQYDINIGYIFNEKKGLGLEWSWNHLKYVMYNNEVRHVKGKIYGQNIDKDTLVSPDFVKFEHTNGNNYCMLSLVKRFVLKQSKNGNFRVSGILKNGVGVLIPKTDSKIMGYHNDGPFKLSGFVVGTMGSIRLDLFKYFFLDTGFQGALAAYTSGIIYQGKVHHNFFSLQFIYSAGLNIPIGKR